MKTEVPYFRPDVQEDEIAEVVSALRSGWLTTGPRVKRFEEEFAAAVGAPACDRREFVHRGAAPGGRGARACRPGDAVLVPTMTFAATAEVVRYLGRRADAGRLRSR